jgi:prevent-host-death family protein
MRTMPISRFKAHALATIDEVATTRQAVIITKRGKPVAEVVPYQGGIDEAKPGRLAHTLVREGDIVSPLGSKLWETAR